MYVFDDARLYSKQAFVAYFMENLNLNANDVVIIDRSTEVGQAIWNIKDNVTSASLCMQIIIVTMLQTTVIFCGIIIMNMFLRKHLILIFTLQQQTYKIRF